MGSAGVNARPYVSTTESGLFKSRPSVMLRAQAEVAAGAHEELDEVDGGVLHLSATNAVFCLVYE